MDVQQTGSGITPILNAHFKPNDNINTDIRYEFNTKMELTNDSKVDDTGMFPYGFTLRKDTPDILSFGIE